MIAADRYRHELPLWLWLWFPPLMILAQLVHAGIDRASYLRVFEGELGIVELATPLLLLAAMVAGVGVLRRRERLGSRWLSAWFACVLFGCLYMAGEELSWGQHLAGWDTPAYLGRINDQQETNLHNVSSWFDQKPRLLLELWVLVGGVIRPLLRGAARARDHWRGWFWPGVVCLPAATLAIAAHLPERLKKLLDLGPLPVEIRWSEAQEYYFALFLLIYLASVRVRLQRG